MPFLGGGESGCFYFSSLKFFPRVPFREKIKSAILSETMRLEWNFDLYFETTYYKAVVGGLEGGKITPFSAKIPLVKSNYRTRIIT